MKKEIIELLKDINPYIEITEELMLLEDVLDSTGILVLITELEHKYGIEIPFENLQIEEFETVCKIAQLVERLS